MAKLVFDKAGEHFFETGVSKCVLFVKSTTGAGYESGVAWNGITSITESPEGAEETAIYADNIKYLSLRSVEEFNASIEAYTYPDQFAVCDGSAEPVTGLKLSQQPRRSFALCYMTKKGNDENPELGEILHVIYGATASPSERAYTTVNDSPEAMTMSWDLTTVPVPVTGYKNVAHLEIDLTKFLAEDGTTLNTKAQAVIDTLYGADGEGEAAKTSTLMLPDAIIAALK